MQITSVWRTEKVSNLNYAMFVSTMRPLLPCFLSYELCFWTFNELWMLREVVIVGWQIYGELEVEGKMESEKRDGSCWVILFKAWGVFLFVWTDEKALRWFQRRIFEDFA
jgi:hypothetical protein